MDLRDCRNGNRIQTSMNVRLIHSCDGIKLLALPKIEDLDNYYFTEIRY